MTTATTHFYRASIQARIKSLNQLVINVELVTLISQLIHQLQKERGISNIVLASEGERFYQKVLIQHGLVDQLLDQLKPHLNQHYLDCAVTHPVNLLNSIARGLLNLECLAQNRYKVLNQQHSTKKSTQYYNQLIAYWIEVVFAAADVVEDPTVCRCLLSLFNLIQAKEYAGQERANGAIGFAETCFSKALSNQLEELSHIQQTHFDYFTHFADKDTLSQWEEHRQSQIVKDFNQIKTMMLSVEKCTVFSSDISEVWFDLTTKRIDALHQIESTLTKRLIGLANTQVDIEKKAIHKKKITINEITQPAASSSQLTNFNHIHLDQKKDNNEPNLSYKLFYELLNEQSETLENTQQELAEIKTVLEEQKWLNRAKLILMQKYQITEAEAHSNLRKSAMNQNKKIVDLAKKVIIELEGNL